MTSRRRQQEDSKIGAVSFRLRDVTISMEKINQIDAVKFTIEQRAAASLEHPDTAVVGLISSSENGTILSLDWSEDVTVSEMRKFTEGDGFAKIAIAQGTSKSAGAR